VARIRKTNGEARKVLGPSWTGLLVPDPRRIDVWMHWEFEKLNAGVVTRPKSLRHLMETPRLETREGDAIDLDRRILEQLAAACTTREQDRLRLPITIHFSADVPDSAFVLDELAAEVLHRIEGWGEAYRYRDGKMWLPQSLAVDLLLRYGGVLQRLMT
jgi:uncharacterized protein (UPF0216 family)